MWFFLGFLFFSSMPGSVSRSICFTPLRKPAWHDGAAESLMRHVTIPTRCHRPPSYLPHLDKSRVRHTLTDPGSCSLSHNIIQNMAACERAGGLTACFYVPAAFNTNSVYSCFSSSSTASWRSKTTEPHNESTTTTVETFIK